MVPGDLGDEAVGLLTVFLAVEQIVFRQCGCRKSTDRRRQARQRERFGRAICIIPMLTRNVPSLLMASAKDNGTTLDGLSFRT